MQGGGQRSFHCHFCGLKFSHKADLNLHQKAEHEKQSLPYVCKRCKRGFARLSGISGHHCILLETQREHIKIEFPPEFETVSFPQQEIEPITIIVEQTEPQIHETASKQEFKLEPKIEVIFTEIFFLIPNFRIVSVFDQLEISNFWDFWDLS